MSERENLRVVHDLFESFGRGDVPGLLGLLDADVDWHIKGPSEVPFYGPHHGHDGVVDFFGKLGASVEFESFEPGAFVAEGDRVVVLGRERGRVKGTGKSFDNEWALVFTFDGGGKVSNFQLYENTAAVAEAFG